MKGKVTQMHVQHVGVRKKVTVELDGKWLSKEAGGMTLGVTVEVPEGADLKTELLAYNEFLRMIVDEAQEEALSEVQALSSYKKPVEAAPVAPVAPVAQVVQQDMPPVQTLRLSPDGQQAWCEQHNVWAKRREKDGDVWYSHKDGESWCTVK